MSSLDDLEVIERETDWKTLTERALIATPPDFAGLDELYRRWLKWFHLFPMAMDREPLKPDFPPEMDHFFWRLANAHHSPIFVEWAERFRLENGRVNTDSEIPDEFRHLVSISTNKRGRPRKDSEAMRLIYRRWQYLVFKSSYEMRRDTFRIFMKRGTCFGFSKLSMTDQYPSLLALTKISDDTGHSVDYVKDIVQRSQKKRQRNNYTLGN